MVLSAEEQAQYAKEAPHLRNLDALGLLNEAGIFLIDNFAQTNAVDISILRTDIADLLGRNRDVIETFIIEPDQGRVALGSFQFVNLLRDNLLRCTNFRSLQDGTPQKDDLFVNAENTASLLFFTSMTRLMLEKLSRIERDTMPFLEGLIMMFAPTHLSPYPLIAQIVQNVEFNLITNLPDLSPKQVLTHLLLRSIPQSTNIIEPVKIGNTDAVPTQFNLCIRNPFTANNNDEILISYQTERGIRNKKLNITMIHQGTAYSFNRLDQSSIKPDIINIFSEIQKAFALIYNEGNPERSKSIFYRSEIAKFFSIMARNNRVSSINLESQDFGSPTVHIALLQRLSESVTHLGVRIPSSASGELHVAEVPVGMRRALLMRPSNVDLGKMMYIAIALQRAGIRDVLLENNKLQQLPNMTRDEIRALERLLATAKPANKVNEYQFDPNALELLRQMAKTIECIAIISSPNTISEIKQEISSISGGPSSLGKLLPYELWYGLKEGKQFDISKFDTTIIAFVTDQQGVLQPITLLAPFGPNNDEVAAYFRKNLPIILTTALIQ